MKNNFMKIVFLFGLVVSASCDAKLYKCVDPKGNLYFTDRACPNASTKEEIQLEGYKSNSKKINKNGITILDWTNRKSGSGNYYYVEGVLKNTSEKQVSNIKIKVKSLNYRGKLVSLDDGYADPTSLYPGSEATFQIMVRNTSEIDKFSLSVSWK